MVAVSPPFFIENSRAYLVADRVLSTSPEFAMNLGIRFYSPREYFFGDERETVWSLKGFNPKKYDHSGRTLFASSPSTVRDYQITHKMALCTAGPLFLPTSTPLIPRPSSEFDEPIVDIVFLVGPPACGKTSLYYRFFEKAGYERIVSPLSHSSSRFPNMAQFVLSRSQTMTNLNDLAFYIRSQLEPSNYVLDVPLASISTRSTSLKLFKSHFQQISSSSFRLRCLNFLVPGEVCKHNSQFRELWDQGDMMEGKKRKFVEEEEFAEWRLTFESPRVEEGESSLFLSLSLAA